jgi:ParB-like chromosome segregation protein Spo0J
MYQKLLKSITDFPQMLKIRPLVIDEKNMVLGGNMRLKALVELGWKKVPVIRAKNLTADQKREFIAKDNIGYGEFEWEALVKDWDVEKLSEWGLDVPVLKEIKDLSEKLESQYKIEIECSSEDEQEKLYNEFQKRNLSCRILTF